MEKRDALREILFLMLIITGGSAIILGAYWVGTIIRSDQHDYCQEYHNKSNLTTTQIIINNGVTTTQIISPNH